MPSALVGTGGGAPAYVYLDAAASPATHRGVKAYRGGGQGAAVALLAIEIFVRPSIGLSRGQQLIARAALACPLVALQIFALLVLREPDLSLPLRVFSFVGFSLAGWVLIRARAKRTHKTTRVLVTWREKATQTEPRSSRT